MDYLDNTGSGFVGDFWYDFDRKRKAFNALLKEMKENGEI